MFILAIRVLCITLVFGRGKEGYITPSHLSETSYVGRCGIFLVVPPRVFHISSFFFLFGLLLNSSGVRSLSLWGGGSSLSAIATSAPS